MRSEEIRRELRSGPRPERDTRRIHRLGRALARERLHLSSRPRRAASDADLLWSRDGLGYKVAARTVASLDDATTFEPAASGDADYLLAVFLEHGTFRLLGMARLPWSMVEWVGRDHGRRRRLRWSAGSPMRGVAELL